ncbi:MAG: hypothetical protein ACREXI_11025 [Caldimonas sp.]
MPRPTTMQVERRFPLVLHKADDDIRALYETAKRAHWNPDTDLPWAENALAGLDPAVRAAARRVWSRRAWVEYTGMTETPALLIRFCLELNRESDPKYFLTVRNTEEAWHVESYHRYAEACGGYVEAPADPAWEPVFNRTLYRDALNADVPIDAYVAAHCAFVDGLEYELAKAWHANATEPLARAVLERCLGDYERHAAFGWMYAQRRAASMGAELRDRVAGALQRRIEDVEFAGYHCVALATGLDTAAEACDLSLCARAGLGAATADEEVEIFGGCLTRSRARFADLGLALPPIRHPTLGVL